MTLANISILNRDVTDEELARIKAGFVHYAVANGVAPQTSDRFGFVAMSQEDFIGCSSGLAYKNGANYSGWFYLTDLFVEQAYRKQGIGYRLLADLEAEISGRGIRHIWTWTAGYEAPEFYRRQGYECFAELKNWYSDGSSRLAFRKKC